jgi:hypothetical protein
LNTTHKYNSIPKQQKNSSIKFTIVLICLLFLGIFSISIYVKFFKPETTLIGGFNWFDEKVIVTVEGQEITVDPMQMFKLQVKKRGTLIVTVNRENDINVRETKYYVGNHRGLILELISNYEDKECVVVADVSNIYYKIDEEGDVKNIVTLSNKPQESFYYEIPNDILLNYFVYPGNYSRSLLPENLPKDEKVLGIFFVNCNNLDNQSSLNSDILGSIYYDEN